MRIADSQIQMASGRKYQSYGKSRQQDTFAGLAGGLYKTQKDLYSMQGQYQAQAYSYNSSGQGFTYGNDLGTKEMDDLEGLQDKNPVILEKPSQLQMNLLDLLLHRFAKASPAFGQRLQNSGDYPVQVFQSSPTARTERVFYYEEAEETEFAAQGQVRTEDGRELNFQIDILMSRTYMEYMDFQIPTLAANLADPLVINMGGDVAEVSDQTFRFDLDADGTEEEVAALGKNSGFLALDKNGDGRINDGTELFGAQSGDGFGDLRQYDSDGNGWIDENDEIFSKLKVWCRNAQGEEILMDLKEADVGAIFLGNASTEFSFNGSDGRQTGQLRSTGFFLKESGGTGTVQQVDLATYDSEQMQAYRQVMLRQTGSIWGKSPKEAAPAKTGQESTVTVQESGGTVSVSQSSQSSAKSQAERRREREEEYRRQDIKSIQKKARRDREAMAELIMKKRMQEKRRLKDLADEQFVERQSLEDARMEKLFEDRREREEFFQLA